MALIHSFLLYIVVTKQRPEERPLSQSIEQTNYRQTNGQLPNLTTLLSDGHCYNG